MILKDENTTGLDVSYICMVLCVQETVNRNGQIWNIFDSQTLHAILTQ